LELMSELCSLYAREGGVEGCEVVSRPRLRLEVDASRVAGEPGESGRTMGSAMFSVDLSVVTLNLLRIVGESGRTALNRG
jgi:hypothetical protein